MKIFSRNRLMREITLILVVKLILLFGLWCAFFSRPVDDHLTDIDVSRVLLGDRARMPPQ